MGQIGIDYRAFNRYDDELKFGLCRLCGKPATGRMWHYCSYEHRDLFYAGVSWAHARHLVWNRDNQKCVKCGKHVGISWSYYDREKKDFVYTDNLANIHHIIPVAFLWSEIFKAIEGCLPEDLSRRKEQLKAILFFHIDNLITLCEKPCHQKEHKKGWYEEVKFMISGQKKFEDYITNENVMEVKK